MKRKRRQMRSLKSIGLWSALIAIFITVLLVYTWCRVQSTQVGYEITRAAEIQQQRMTLQNNLKIELARLKSPERITKIARDHLGLVVPKPEQTIVMP
jgi:cell division protein FtsL